MSDLFSTLLGSVLGLGLAVSFGLLLGRVALEWLPGRGVTTLLVETRGGLLGVVVVPLWITASSAPHWVVIGCFVGMSRSIALARWTGTGASEWSPAIRGGLALGRSGALLLLRAARRRGAVVAVLASIPLEVALLEGCIRLVNQVPVSGLGAVLVEGSVAVARGSAVLVEGRSVPLAAMTLALLVGANEWLARRVLRGPGGRG